MTSQHGAHPTQVLLLGRIGARGPSEEGQCEQPKVCREGLRGAHSDGGSAAPHTSSSPNISEEAAPSQLWGARLHKDSCDSLDSLFCSCSPPLLSSTPVLCSPPLLSSTPVLSSPHYLPPWADVHLWIQPLPPLHS